MVVITTSLPNSEITPPVYVAGSFTEWQPVEMDAEEIQTEAGIRHTYTKKHDVSPGDHQYKFRLGPGDWWICNDSVPVSQDESGNRNNIITAKEEPEKPKAPVLATESKVAPTVTADKTEKEHSETDGHAPIPEKLASVIPLTSAPAPTPAATVESKTESLPPAAPVKSVEPTTITSSVPAPVAAIKQTPAPVPVKAVEPTPAPTPVPVPAPASAKSDESKPTPAPVKSAKPTPAPALAPTPAVKPTPAPEPVNAVESKVESSPAPLLSEESISASAPAPVEAVKPKPAPEPVMTAPAAAPVKAVEPKAVSSPAPVPVKIIEPTPAPIPAPVVLPEVVSVPAPVIKAFSAPEEAPKLNGSATKPVSEPPKQTKQDTPTSNSKAEKTPKPQPESPAWSKMINGLMTKNNVVLLAALVAVPIYLSWAWRA